jgi:hypothetical protein
VIGLLAVIAGLIIAVIVISGDDGSDTEPAGTTDVPALTPTTTDEAPVVPTGTTGTTGTTGDTATTDTDSGGVSPEPVPDSGGSDSGGVTPDSGGVSPDTGTDSGGSSGGISP